MDFLQAKIREAPDAPELVLTRAVEDLEDMGFEFSPNAGLGAGAFGFVLRATYENKVCAVKLIPLGRYGHLSDAAQSLAVHAEFDKIKALSVHEDLHDIVVEPHPGFPQVLRLREDKVLCYVMNEVGERPTRTIENTRTALDLLARLHREGECHGDPRVPNTTLFVNDEMKWIDFRFDVDRSIKRDIEIFVRSFWEREEGVDIDIELVRPQIESYIADSDKNTDALFFGCNENYPEEAPQKKRQSTRQA